MSTTTDPKQILKWMKPCPIDFSPDLAERIRIANRGRRWAMDARRDGRLHELINRLATRARLANDLATRLRHEGKEFESGYWAALRDVYYKAHKRALERN